MVPDRLWERGPTFHILAKLCLYDGLILSDLLWT